VSAGLIAEALRVNARYVEEVVIGWDLCPWAARAWRNGEVERRVLLDERPDVGAVAAAIAELGPLPTCAVGLLLFPRVELEVGAWESFAERVRRTGGPFHVAAFHPRYRPAGVPAANAAQLVSLIRRTPDPTLQLVRASAIDALARDGRDLSAEIAGANFATVSARDPGALERLLDELRRDRDDGRTRLLSGSRDASRRSAP
jgi:hypothetical protein